MILTYRYQLLPTKRQHRALETILESQRQLYNAALEERIDAYRKARITRTYIDQTRALTELRHSDAEFSAVPANLQRATLKRLDDAYRGFFHRAKDGKKPGFPRFRGRGWFNSFGFRQFSGITFSAGRLRFKGCPGALRVHLHRPLPPILVIKSCVFKREHRSWLVCFAVEVPELVARPVERAVGVDLGITTFAALSDGGFIPSLRAARRSEARVRRASRSFARTKKGSNGRMRARAQLARCHRSAASQRLEHLHQATARLIRDYDLIAIEALQLRALTRGPLAKDVYDASWVKFISMLRYKAARAGVRLVEVDPRGTSQYCFACGTRVSKALQIRQHDCPACGISLDRDINAALNILIRAGVSPGLPNVAVCGVRASENIDSNAQTRSESRHCPQGVRI